VLHVRYCILGAGPSGLTFACALKQAGETSFLVLEKEDEVGGLCRSKEVDGSPLDIGGGHFLDLRRPTVLDFLFQYMPREEWAEHRRIATIRLRGREVEHPLEGNLWQLPIADQIDFLQSMAEAGCVRGESQPKAFDHWVIWKLGLLVANEYLLPYNRKMWSLPLDQLGTGWLYKLPSVSFRETLKSCLERNSVGVLPGHGRFLYPVRHGYGEIWRRMGSALGDRLCDATPVTAIDPDGKVVNGSIRYEHLITSIPWPLWTQIATVPTEVREAISMLKHTAMDVDYHPENQASPAHWIYDPDETVPFHRLLLRHNFCLGSRGYWSETNVRRAVAPDGFRHRNEFAYPIDTVAKPAALEVIRQWAARMGIRPLGRWGNWEHMNSDVAVEFALLAAKNALQS
jgi:protoporphyrinogen oxidase